tara:strand:- start:14656 stop:15903 length:1248 start_codon:yes stop_codon:yes gene_type:complete
MKQQVKISKVKGNPSNPRIIKNDKFKKLVKSIQEFPEMLKLRPIVVDEEMMVLGGNMRLKASKAAGLTEVWIEVAEGLTEEKKREFIVKDNVGFGEWEWDILANEWDSVQLTEWGLDVWENIDDAEPEAGLIEDDEIPEVKESKAKRGDIWQLGDHRIMCGDSTSSDDVAKLMNKQKADLIFTDPPYGISYEATNFEIIQNDKLRGEPLYAFLHGAFVQLFKHSKENPAVYVWHASSTQMIFETALNDAGFEVKQQLIWNKGMVLSRSDYHWSHEPCFYIRKRGYNNEWYGDRKNKTILREGKIEYDKFKKNELIQIINAMRDESSNWEIKKDSVTTYLHPTQKPVDLCMRSLLNNTQRKDNVLDLFLGSGSTLIAAEKLKRKCYGMELDEKYCDVIIERWEQFTGQKAIKNGTE